MRFAGPPAGRSGSSTVHRAAPRPTSARTLRGRGRAGGEPIRRYWREPGDRLRRLVLLLDVSGSMEPYARAMLRFVHAAVAGRQRVEAFALGTRLTRVTRELERPRSRTCALRQAGERVQRLERRHPARRMPADVQRRVGRARPGPRLDRRDPVRRLGPRRPDLLAEQMRGLQRVDTPPDLGQPAESHAGLRAAGPWDGGGAAVC